MSGQSSPRLVAGIVGSIVEWYDFTIYATFAAVIGAHFFPSQSATASVLAAFATFGTAFLVRPLGGVFFGHIGDRIGRKRTLAASVLLMSGASVVIGLLPTYAAIGTAAPILLIIARCAQGFAVGGELSGAMTYVV